jgi:hypothetical protein
MIKYTIVAIAKYALRMDYITEFLDGSELDIRLNHNVKNAVIEDRILKYLEYFT